MSGDEAGIKPELTRELSGGAKAEPEIALLNELASRSKKSLEGIDGLTPSQLELIQTQDFDSWEDFRTTVGLEPSNPAYAQIQRKVRKYARKRSNQTSDERPGAEKKARTLPKTLETLKQTQRLLDENDAVLKAIEENCTRRRSGGSVLASTSLSTTNANCIKQLCANLQQTAVAFLKAAPDTVLLPAPFTPPPEQGTSSAAVS
jgi:hypothetical protein